MKPATPKPAAVKKPPICRCAPSKSLGTIASETTVKSRLDVAGLYAEINVRKAAIWRPVMKLIQNDPTATEAASRPFPIDRQLSNLLSPGRPPVGLSTPPLTVSSDGTLVAPPYDYPQVGPDTGTSPVSSVNMFNGTFHVGTDSGEDYDGVFSAVVGLGIELMTSRDGIVEIDPYIQTHSQWLAFSEMLLSSYVEGHISLTVIDSTTEAQVVEPAVYQVFSQTATGWNTDDRVISAQYLNISFGARSQTPYQVWVHGYVTGNQSGKYAFDGSTAGGYMDVTIPFIWAKML